jgi:hypothetical protein
MELIQYFSTDGDLNVDETEDLNSTCNSWSICLIGHLSMGDIFPTLSAIGCLPWKSSIYRKNI